MATSNNSSCFVKINYRDLYYSGQLDSIFDSTSTATAAAKNDEKIEEMDRTIVENISQSIRPQQLFDNLKKLDNPEKANPYSLQYNLALCEYVGNLNPENLNAIIEKFESNDDSDIPPKTAASMMFLVLNYLIDIANFEKANKFLELLKAKTESLLPFLTDIDYRIRSAHLEFVIKKLNVKSDKNLFIEPKREVDASAIVGYQIDLALKFYNDGIYYLKAKQFGRACTGFMHCLSAIQIYNKDRKELDFSLPSKQILTSRIMMTQALYYYAYCLMRCKNYEKAFEIFEKMLSEIPHPLICLKMAECCIGYHYVDNRYYYENEIKRKVLHKVVSVHHVQYLMFRNPVLDRENEVKSNKRMAMLCCSQYLDLAMQVLNSESKVAQLNNSNLPKFLKINNIESLKQAIRMKKTFCFLKLQRYDDALQQCAEAESVGFETNTARYTFGLYKAQALSLKGKQFQDLKILEEQFAETYSFQFSEKDQSPLDHQRDKILRELSQFNSGVCHFRGDDLISSRNCIETQRFNLENNINPLKSVFGIIQEICLNRREGGSESRSFARILDDHFQFSIYQDI